MTPRISRPKAGSIALPSLLALALALGAGPAAQAQMMQPPPRTLNVAGHGEVRAQPDLARVTLGVEARRVKLEEARAEVGRTVDAVLRLTRDLAIDPEYVQATRVNIQPEYNWDNAARERTLIGYVVRRQVQVELRNLDNLGRLLERAVDAGVNQVGDPELDSSRRRELEREALAKAVEDARLNADTLARAAGVQVGAARSLVAQSVAPPQPMFRMAAMAEAAPGGDAAPYQSGEMTFTATVQAEFDLVVP